jgi:hypothetical protein
MSSGSTRIYTWQEDHRIWRVGFPISTAPATARAELSRFATYRA